MRTLLAASLLTLAFALPQAAPAHAQAEQKDRKSSLVTLVGCIDATRTTARDITFQDSSTGSRYRLTGKGLDRFLGARVEIMGGSSGKRLTIRGGLVPSPNIAAQGGAIDPAQESIARQPGGAATGAGVPLREFPVASIRAVDGACK